MSTHRYRVVIGVAGIVFGAMVVGLGPTGVHAQAPPRADDAAAEGLRSLYVPGGLSPDQAVKQVVATSPDLKRTKALLDEAKGGAMQAMAGLVPQLELLGRYTRLSPVDSSGTYDIPGIGPITLDFPSLTEQTATDAILTYSFTRSLAEAMPAYRAAKKSKTAAQYQIQAERNDVAFDGRQAYYEYARAEAGLAVANFALEAATSQREETQALVGAGSAARVDLMRVQAQEEAARVAVEQAKLGVQVSARALQTLMHTDELPSLGEDLSEEVSGLPTQSEGTLLERAYQNRPDLRALLEYIEVTEHQLKSAKGSGAPDLLARGSVQYANPNLRVVPQRQRFESTWEVSAVLRWTPNGTVAASGRAHELRAALQQAEADTQLMRDAIRVEVAQGYHGVLAAKSAIESARLGLEAAREGYRVTREQLQAGIVNTTTLLQAQAELIRAQVDVVESAIGIRVAKAQLRRAIGEMP
ncbi:MAG: TolC family protein [Deltaproteobacteria bacterium]|jgi:outer membrane protein TolC|nr:TolC family protein [Deltaproteobacteria bacterium]